MATGLALVRFADDGAPASQIFVVDADGEFHQLTGLGSAASLGARLPVWSPDGRQVAFGPLKVGAGTDRFLSVIMADGSGERPVAALGDEFGLPFGWSPDGASLLFFDIDAVDGPAMWLADVARGEVTHLGAGQLPRWLPDGRRISFQRGVEGRDPADPRAEMIYVMSLEDGDVAEFADASDAIWSPDGIAVVLQHSTGFLRLADADGSNPRDLVRGWAPVWSPDGSQIVFAYDHNRDGVPMLAAVDLSGRVLWFGVAGSSPTWSPDGSRIAVEVLFPDLSVKVLNAETGDVLWKTAGAEPAWGP